MKVPLNKIDSILLKIPNNIKVILLHGSDLGLIDERSCILRNNFLGKEYESLQSINISEIQLKDNPDIIAEQAYNISLFDNSLKCITIDNAKDFITKKIKTYLENINQQTLLILKGGELSASSSLRKLCEQSKENVLSIPCYKDSLISLKSYIEKKLNTEQITIDPSALNFLTNSLGNDRGITKSELEKLILYVHNKKQITLNNVEELVSNNKLYTIDKFIYSLFDCNIKVSYPNLEGSLQEYNSILIIRSIINHVQKLIFVKTMCEENISIELAIQKLTPPIFFQFINQFKHQIVLWNNKSLTRLLNSLIYLEIDCKLIPNISEILLKNFIIRNFIKNVE